MGKEKGEVPGVGGGTGLGGGIQGGRGVQRCTVLQKREITLNLTEIHLGTS